MCRSIQVLHRAEGPASEEEVHAAALQFVRKISGYRQPSRANQAAFATAVDAVEGAVQELLASLEPRRVPRRRDG